MQRALLSQRSKSTTTRMGALLFLGSGSRGRGTYSARPMPPMTDALRLDEARRIALGAQGFGDPRPTGRVDRRHLRRVLQRVGLLQLDSVNVAVRAHYMPLFSRLGPYPMAAI